jgi:hypothetical protein
MPNQEVTSNQLRIASVIIAREEDLEGALVRGKTGGITSLTTGASE